METEQVLEKLTPEYFIQPNHHCHQPERGVGEGGDEQCGACPEVEREWMARCRVMTERQQTQRDQQEITRDGVIRRRCQPQDVADKKWNARDQWTAQRRATQSKQAKRKRDECAEMNAPAEHP